MEGFDNFLKGMKLVSKGLFVVEEWLDSEIWIKSLERFDNFLNSIKLVSKGLFVAEE